MKVYTLRGDHPQEGEMEQGFTAGERAAAICIAKGWLEKGWKPFLYSKTYDGDFIVLLNFRNHERKLRLAA